MNHYTLYRPRLYLASDHPPYRREVELQLARICATQSGKLLIAAIGLGAKNVRIRPSFNGPFFPFQDVVKQSDYPDALEAAAHSYNWYEIGCGQNVMVPDALRIGTGRGAETVVEFHPAGFLEAARRRGETVLGYRIEAESNDSSKTYGVHTNPKKSLQVTFAPEDKVIVIAEE